MVDVAAVLETFQKGKAPALFPDLTSHVPVEQYEAVVSELGQAKTQMATLSEQAQAAKVEQVIKTNPEDHNVFWSKKFIWGQSGVVDQGGPGQLDDLAVIVVVDNRRDIPASPGVVLDLDREGASGDDAAG